MDISELRIANHNLAELIIGYQKESNQTASQIKEIEKKIVHENIEEFSKEFSSFVEHYTSLNSKLLELAKEIESFENNEIEFLKTTINDELSQEDIKQISLKLNTNFQNLRKELKDISLLIYDVKKHIENYNYQINHFQATHKKELKRNRTNFDNDFYNALKIEPKYLENLSNAILELEEILNHTLKSANINNLIKQTIKQFYNELEKEYTSFNKNRLGNELEKFHRVKPRNKYKKYLRNQTEQVIEAGNLMNNLNYLIISELIIQIMNQMRLRHLNIYNSVKNKVDQEEFARKLNNSLFEKKAASMFCIGKSGFFPAIKESELKIINIGNKSLVYSDYKELYLQVLTIMIQYADYFYKKNAFESDYQRGYINIFESSHQSLYLEGVLFEFSKTFLKKINGQRNQFVNAINKVEEKIIERNIMQAHTSSFNDFFNSFSKLSLKISNVLSSNKLLLIRIPDKMKRLSIISKQTSPFKEKKSWFKRIFSR